MSHIARERSLNEIKVFLSKLNSPNSIVFGDFNMEFSEEQLQNMKPLIDAWTCSNKFIGYLNSASEEQLKKGWTFHTWEMKSRIDYAFLTEELFQNLEEVRIVGGEFVPSLSVGISEYASTHGVQSVRGVVFPSDHRFIVVIIKLQ